MFRTTKHLAGLVLAALVLVAPAQALDTTNIAFVQTASVDASVPVGHAEFCQRRPAECGVNRDAIAAMPLDQERWTQLLNVNASVNHAVVPVTDEDLYQVSEFWTYPNGFGDCEDFALLKRRELMSAGWSASTLLMAVVREPNGDGHAVLMVRTDRGDFVLDNKDGAVKLWSDTPYQFIKRQSQADSGKWVDMLDDRTLQLASVQ